MSALLARLVAALALLLTGLLLPALLMARRVGLALLAGFLVRVLLVGVIHILLLEDFRGSNSSRINVRG
jgi:hypothetical protein